MSYLRNFNHVTRNQRTARLLTSILAVCLIALTMLTALSVPAHAAGGVDFEGVMQLSAYLTQNSATTIKAEGLNDYTKNSGSVSGGQSTNDWAEPTATDLNNETDIPKWDTLVAMSEMQNKIASDYPKVKRCCATASQIVNTFRDSASYQKAIGKLSSIGWKYNATTREFTVNASGDQHA